MNSLNIDNKSTMSSKTFLLFVSLIFSVFAAIAVYFFEGHVKRDALNSIDQEFTETNQRLKKILTSSILQSKSDLRFLYSTPPIAGLPRAHFNDGIDPYDGTTYQQWKERLETIFIGFMENNLAVEQLRIIAVSAEGKELIRVQRVGASVEAVPDYSLQAKSAEPYFLPSSLLEVNQIYMSPMSLNKEFGEVVFPYKPMLRFSIPIYSDKGKRFAFLIMNVNATPLIQKLKETIFDYSQLVISSSEGDFIYHPYEGYQFTRDLDPSITWQSVYDQPVQHQGLYLVTATSPTTQQFYVHSEKVQTRPGKSYGFINFNLLVAKQYVDKVINEKRVMTYSLLILIILFTGVLLLTFYRNANRSQLLAEARREASAIVEGSIDAIVGLNLEGKLTSLNKTAENLLMLASSMSIGKASKDIDFLARLPIPDYIADIQNSKTQIKDECSISENGVVNYFAISVSPVFSDQRVLIGVALIIRDISKEQEAANKVKRLNSELEAKVRQRTQALAEAKDEAIKHSDIKSAFISNISHELRTPLNGVIGTLNILKRQTLPDNARKLVDMMELSASNLRLLINDILDLSKIESGKLDLNIQKIKPQLLIESLVESCSVRAFDKGLDVYLDTSGLACYEVKTDPLRLTQIINNLISNAIKFTEQGFIKVTASSEQVSNTEHTLKITVQDTGIGIELNTQRHLFDAFQQANSSIADNYGGTGLGLSICKQLCNIMNGDIAVNSAINEGSAFSFYIKVGSSQAPKPDVSDYYNHKRILLISNNSQCHDVMQKLLKVYGADVKVSDINTLADEHTSNVDYVFIDYESIQAINPQSLVNSLANTLEQGRIILLHLPTNPLPKALDTKVTSLNKPITQTNLLRVAGFEVSENEPLYLLSENRTTENDITADVLTQLKGCRILIVDDNDINIEVALGALDGLPIEVITAQNGQEALEILLNSKASNEVIHCILMDCQMPVLNGYEVCEKIRAAEAGQYYAQIPIIAMTASAMAGEKEKCIAVGMSDYVSKPIQAHEVQSKVVKWSLSNYEGDSLSTEQSNLEPLWDREQALVRLLNKEALLIKICEMFITKAPLRLKELQSQINAKDSEQVRQVAHALKGMCGEISASHLRSLFADVEIKASQGNLNLEKTIIEIEQILTQLITDITQWLEEN